MHAIPKDLTGMCLVATGCYAVHILEEAAFDFPAWLSESFGVRMQWAEFWTLNGAVLVLGLGASRVAVVHPAIASGFPALMILNALVSHLGSTLVTARFSPGLITGLLLFLPVGGWCLLRARAEGLSGPGFLVSFLLGGAVLLFPLAWFRLLRRLVVRPRERAGQRSGPRG